MVWVCRHGYMVQGERNQSGRSPHCPTCRLEDENDRLRQEIHRLKERLAKLDTPDNACYTKE